MCPFFDQLDAILGSRAASQPNAVLESSTGVTITDLHVDEEGNTLPPPSNEGVPDTIHEQDGGDSAGKFSKALISY